MIRPQKGYQEDALSSSADILIGGSGAGVGKTFSLLLEAVRNVGTKGYTGQLFRRTSVMIRNAGGLWDNSKDLYMALGGTARESDLEWLFKPQGKIKMSHLEHEKDKYNHQGGQYAFIGFDELTHFSRSQFLYLLSRNRSTCGIRPYVRATCNPDPDSWVKELVDPWIDQKTGYPREDMQGVILYMVVDQERFIFGETPDEVIEACPHLFDLLPAHIDKREIIKTVTFISGDIYQNKKLLEKDPSYLGNLLALPEEDRLRLLGGNWLIRSDGKEIFAHSAIADMWTLTLTQDAPKHFVTCDVARFGRDLATIYVWEGFKIVEIHIFTKSRTTDITGTIEKIRERYAIPKRNVAVDQDGVGGGVIDEGSDRDGGSYVGFSGGASAMEDPKSKTRENYQNLKTQCAYRMGTRVNEAQVAIASDCAFFVDCEMTDEVDFGKGEKKSVRKLLSEDLRSFKRKNVDRDGKIQMSSKQEQKNALGRSPDNGDAFIIREIFELDAPKEQTPRTIHVFRRG